MGTGRQEPCGNDGAFPAPERPSDEEFDKEHDMIPDDEGEVMGEDDFNQAVGDE